MIKCISIFVFIVLNLTCFGQKMNRFSIDVNGSGIKYFLDDNYSSKLNLGFNSNFNYYLNNKYKISLGVGVFNKDYIRYTGSNQNQDIFEYELNYQHLNLNFGYTILRKSFFSTEVNGGISYLRRSKCDLAIYYADGTGILIDNLSEYKNPILASFIGTTFSFTFFDRIKLNLSPLLQYKFLKEDEGFQDFGLSDDQLNFNFQLGLEFYFN
jgi:hypothetical protein